MLASISRLDERNTPGGCKLQLIAVDDVVSVPDPVAGNISTDIEVLSGAGFITIYGIRFTQLFREDWDVVNGRQVARASVSMEIAKDRLALLPGLWDLKPRRYLVLHHSLNSSQKLMGTKAEPAMVRVVNLDHGANPLNDRNRYALEVTVTRSTPCPFYLGDAADAIPPGCPTLATLLAAETGADIWALLDNTQQADLLAAAGVVSFSGLNDGGPPYTNSLVEP